MKHVYHDGYCSDDTFADVAKRKNTCQSFTCTSPLFILSRWLNGRNSRKRLKKVVDTEKKIMRGDDDIVSDETGKDLSFNLGLGFGLLYLIAISRKNIELNKADNNKQLCVSASSTNTNKPHPEKEGETLRARSLTLREIVFGSSRFKGEKSLRIDQLEAELVAEFDRFQLHTEEEQEHEDCYSEVNIEDSAPEESNSMNSEVVIDDHHEEDYCSFYSVPAVELERKLHELLEERQEEQINELEEALEYAVQELRDRERELRWWRDTARLVCKHLPDIRDIMFFRQAKHSRHHSRMAEIVTEVNG